MKSVVFKEGEQLFLVYCPKCHAENYAMNVAAGVCAWCGYVAKEEDCDE